MQELEKILEEIEDEAMHNPEVGRKQCEGMVRAMNIIRTHMSGKDTDVPTNGGWIPVEEPPEPYRPVSKIDKPDWRDGMLRKFDGRE